MKILVTNDDGVYAPGILALAQAMRALGEVTILAPDRNWTASGHTKTLHSPMRIQTVKLADGTEALTTDGSPSDCVALALLGAVPDRPDLVVSGINPRANLGHDVTYSGTVTAAMEAVIEGIPGFAFSIDSHTRDENMIDFGPAAQAAQMFVNTAVQSPLEDGIVLSVNFPELPLDQIKGWQVTRQGRRIYRDELDARQDPHGKPYYWIGGLPPIGIPDEGTDIGALAEGYVSVTPLQLDLTAYPVIDRVKAWELPEF